MIDIRYKKALRRESGASISEYALALTFFLIVGLGIAEALRISSKHRTEESISSVQEGGLCGPILVDDECK